MRRLVILAACLGLCWPGMGAKAQDLGSIVQGNMAFDQQFWGALQRMQQQNAMAQQQIWQSYLLQNGPRLRQQYQAYLASGGMPVSFEQFAYYMLMTADGTNVDGALRHQREQFGRLQDAYRTQRQGGESYIQGMQENSRRMDRALDNYSEQAIRGNAPYVDQYGRTVLLPYGAQPGQVINQGGNLYLQDQQGTYYQYQGNGYWARMGAGQMR
jgi:hypothetical protein